MLQTEKIEKILDWQLSWISAADSRLTLVLPLSTAMLGALSAFAPKPAAWTLESGIPAAFAIFFLCLSILFSGFATFPRTTGTKGSVIFFGGIASHDLDQYESNINSIDEGGYAADLIKQCHVNALIASTKFNWVKRGMVCLLLSTIPWTLAIYNFFGS